MTRPTFLCSPQEGFSVPSVRWWQWLSPGTADFPHPPGHHQRGDQSGGSTGNYSCHFKARYHLV